MKTVFYLRLSASSARWLPPRNCRKMSIAELASPSQLPKDEHRRAGLGYPCRSWSVDHPFGDRDSADRGGDARRGGRHEEERIGGMTTVLSILSTRGGHSCRTGGSESPARGFKPHPGGFKPHPCVFKPHPGVCGTHPCVFKPHPGGCEPHTCVLKPHPGGF